MAKAQEEREKANSNPFDKFVKAFLQSRWIAMGTSWKMQSCPLSLVIQSRATTDEEDERAKQRIAAQNAKGDELDAGEKLFNFFFRPQEGEVAGLARTGGAPDTYPATKTEFADPVDGDSAEVQLLRPMLKNTNLEYCRSGWRMILASTAGQPRRGTSRWTRQARA